MGKKFFTLSLDDGVSQDKRVIEILNRYDFKGATFNINTGLFGANWEWVATNLKCEGLSHKRFTKEEIESGIYNGFDVIVHTKTHPFLPSQTKERIILEVNEDAASISKIFGTSPCGMAYPGGGTNHNDYVINTIVENTNMRFGRTIVSTHSFNLPSCFMKWNPTCSIIYNELDNLIDDYIKLDTNEDKLFYLWGHSYELDAYNLWDKFESTIKKIAKCSDIIKITNTDFYNQFKDSIPSVIR